MREKLKMAGDLVMMGVGLATLAAGIYRGASSGQWGSGDDPLDLMMVGALVLITTIFMRQSDEHVEAWRSRAARWEELCARGRAVTDGYKALLDARDAERGDVSLDAAMRRISRGIDDGEVTIGISGAGLAMRMTGAGMSADDWERMSLEPKNQRKDEPS